MLNKLSARLLLTAASLFPVTLLAADSTWIKPGTGDWFEGTNWSTHPAIPTGFDEVTIGEGTAQVGASGAESRSVEVLNTGALTVEGGGTLAVSESLFVNDGGTAAIMGAGSSVQSKSVAVGVTGISQLTISSGATVTTAGGDWNTESFIGGWSLGGSAGGTGTVTVTGTGSRWNISTYLMLGSDPYDIGAGSHGTLNVLAGGKVVLGEPGHGLLDSGLFVGNGGREDSQGNVLVSGAGSQLTAVTIALGQGSFGNSVGASGTLTINDGGLVQNRHLILGSSGGAGSGAIFLQGSDGNRGVLETEKITAERGSLTISGGLLRVVSSTSSPISLLNGFGAAGTSATIGTEGAWVDTNGHQVSLDDLGGVGGLTKLGTGTLFLGNSSFTGGVTVEEGELAYSGNFAPVSPLVVNGGTVNVLGSSIIGGVNVSSLSGTGGEIWVGDGGLNVNQSGSTTYAGAIIDYGSPGWLVKSGTGTLELTGDNSYLGGTTLTGGTLRAGSATALPQNSSYDVDGGALDLNGHDLTMSNLTSTGGEIKLGTATLTMDQASDVMVDADISGGGRIVKTGTGRMIYSGESTLTLHDGFAGATSVRQGVLWVEGGGGGGKLIQPNAAVYVGELSGDAGQLLLRNGATATSYRGYLGLRAGSYGYGLVESSGSKWDNAASFAVGYEGGASLDIRGGGKVTSTEGYIGYAGTATGHVWVTGTGSEWLNQGSLGFYIGRSGSGTLTIENGGSVIVDNGMGQIDIARYAGSTGTLNFGSHDLLAPTAGGTISGFLLSFGEGTGVINFNQTDTVTLDVSIVGHGLVTQRGSGTTILNGMNEHTGPTTVSAGKLLVDGGIFFSETTVQTGGALGGIGFLADVVLENGAILAPGADQAIGHLTAESLVWNSGATLLFDLGSSTGDLLTLSETLTLDLPGGLHAFTFVDTGWKAGDTYTLITFNGSPAFDADDFTFTNGGGFAGDFFVTGNAVQFTLTTVPEPSSWGLVFVGLLGAGFAGLRRHRSCQAV